MIKSSNSNWWQGKHLRQQQNQHVDDEAVKAVIKQQQQPTLTKMATVDWWGQEQQKTATPINWWQHRNKNPSQHQEQ